VAKKNSQLRTGFYLDTATNILSNPKMTYNIDQEIITITKDKLELCLLKNQKLIEKKHDWIAPLGLFLSLLTTLLVSDFNKDWIFTKTVWNAVFVITTAISFGWLLHAGAGAIKFRNRGSVEELIRNIRAESNQD
jgi:hypothetical protein